MSRTNKKTFKRRSSGPPLGLQRDGDGCRTEAPRTYVRRMPRRGLKYLGFSNSIQSAAISVRGMISHCAAFGFEPVGFI